MALPRSIARHGSVSAAFSKMLDNTEIYVGVWYTGTAKALTRNLGRICQEGNAALMVVQKTLDEQLKVRWEPPETLESVEESYAGGYFVGGTLLGYVSSGAIERPGPCLEDGIRYLLRRWHLMFSRDIPVGREQAATEGVENCPAKRE